MIRVGFEFMRRPGLGPQIVRAFAGSAGLRILGMAVSFLVGIQLARSLGAEGYGVYGLAMSIVALLAVPVECGLPQLVTREAAVAHVDKDRAKLAALLHWAPRISLYSAALVSLLTVVAIFALGQDLGSGLRLTILAGLWLLPLVALLKIHAAALRGMQKLILGQLSEVLVRPLLFSLLLFVITAFFFPLSAPVAMLLGVLSAGIALVVTVFLLSRLTGDRLTAVSPMVYSRDWFSSAIPMAVTEGVRVLQSHLLILVLGLMTTEALVGVFRVSSAVSVMVGVSITVVNIVNAPLVARFFTEKDTLRLQRLLGWSAVVMTLFTLGLMLPFIFVGEFLLGTVFGPEFAGGSSALTVLLVGVLINSVFGSSATLLNMTGHQRRVTRNSLVALLGLAVLSPILIKHSGIEGAAVASAISALIWNGLMWWDVKRLLRIDSSAASIFLRRGKK